MKTFYIQKNNTQQGPFSLDELKDHNISKDTMVWFEGLPDWIQASKVEELNEFFIQKDDVKKTPPPFNAKNNTTNSTSKIKKGYKPRNIIITITVLLIITTIVAFLVIQHNQQEILRKQLEEQKVKIENQEIIEAVIIQAENARVQAENAKIQAQKEALRQKEFSELNEQLDNAVVNLRSARLKLEDIKQFKLLRTQVEKEQEIIEQLSNIRNWEKEVLRLKKEIDAHR